jgi:hypothetical protein
LRWHRGDPAATRLDIVSNGVVSSKATITAIGSDETFAVASWFSDSGEPANVVLLAEWVRLNKGP